MAILQSTRPGANVGKELTQEIFRPKVLDKVMEIPIRVLAVMTKVLSLGESELRLLAEVSEASPRRMLGGKYLGGSLYALQSRYSLPTVPGLTVFTGSDAVADLRHWSVSETGSSHEGVVVDDVDLEDISWQCFQARKKWKRSRGRRKLITCIKSHVNGGLT